MVSGRKQELPAGDTLLGVGTIPFYTAAGTLDTIHLTGDNKVPFVKTDGSSSNIPLVL